MADEEKQEQEETPEEQPETAAEEADAGESPGASDEVAEDAEVPAAATEPEPADTGREAEDVGGDVPAEDAEVPAATSEPEPAGNEAEGEASGGDGSQDVGEEILSPKELRKRERSRASDPARPERSAEERATERAERRGVAADSRRHHRAARRRKRGEPGTGTPPAPHEPGPKKVRQGTVVSTGGDKTITVEIAVVRRHPTYEKVVRHTSKLRAHDEGNEAQRGDVVRVVESRPLSRTKRWRLLEVLERAPR